ncbi:MAG: hypothetical protein HN348_35435 [Proteobacteria bacterium]|jgi:hypothetical protein|nr:hypothetical protein [Pseudomonadota bacterium]
MTVPFCFSDGTNPTLTGLDVTTRIVHDADEVLNAVKGHGWVCFCSEVVALDDEHPLAITDDMVLSAELVQTDGTTLHIRNVGKSWQLTCFVEKPDGADALRFDDMFESTFKGRRMKYRTYWRKEDVDNVPVWRPWVGVFAGWEHGEAK